MKNFSIAAHLNHGWVWVNKAGGVEKSRLFFRVVAGNRDLYSEPKNRTFPTANIYEQRITNKN